MIQFLRGVFEARANVIRFEIRIVFENLRLGHPGGQEVEHVLDANAHPTNARPPAALVGIEGDTFRKLHVRYVAPWVAFRKQGFIRVVVLSSGRPWRRRSAPCRPWRRSPHCNGTPRLKNGKTGVRATSCARTRSLPGMPVLSGRASDRELALRRSAPPLRQAKASKITGKRFPCAHAGLELYSRQWWK